MSLTGYLDPPTQPEAVLSLDSSEVRNFCSLTTDLPVTAIAGLVEHSPGGKPHITQIVAADGNCMADIGKSTWRLTRRTSSRPHSRRGFPWRRLPFCAG
jgi:hypothetical protein